MASVKNQPPVPQIIERPLPFVDKRRALTLDYIRAHYDPGATDVGIVPEMVVIHWSGRDSLLATLASFSVASLPFWRRDIEAGGMLNVSAHFIVGRDGKIHRLLPETMMACHVIGLNPVAIGIENVGGPARPLTEAQLYANADLVRYLADKYASLRYLIGHHEYGRFRGTALWRERDPAYFTPKQDPGPEFMARLRAKVSDLSLAGAVDA